MALGRLGAGEKKWSGQDMQHRGSVPVCQDRTGLGCPGMKLEDGDKAEGMGCRDDVREEMPESGMPVRRDSSWLRACSKDCCMALASM